MGAGSLMVAKIAAIIFKKHYTEARALRDEMRGEIDKLKREVKALSDEVHGWREKYYDMCRQNMTYKVRCDQLEVEVHNMKCILESSSL